VRRKRWKENTRNGEGRKKGTNRRIGGVKKGTNRGREGGQ
jgi:hypothetical protein